MSIRITITQEEYETLTAIHSTEGAEVVDYEGEYDELVRKGLLTVSGARGPGKRWRRATLTDRGIVAISDTEVVIEG